MRTTDSSLPDRNRSPNTRSALLRWVTVAVAVLAACQGLTVVTVTPAATSLHAGETTIVTAHVTVRGNAVPTTAVAFASGNVAAGTVAPANGTTDAAGDATTTFTALVVAEDTPVEVTAHRVETGRSSITVKPPIGFADFGTTPPTTTVATAEVTVAPSLVPGGGTGSTLLLTYVVTASATAPAIKSFSVTFAQPVNFPAAAGVLSSSDKRNWQFPWPASGLTMTVTGTSDASPGGVAIFDVLDTAIRHAKISVAGPK